MEQQTTVRASKKATAPKAIAPQPQATITKMVPREDSRKQKLIARKLGGTYRVIHGQIAIARPWAEWHYPDGITPIPHEPRQVMAVPGDEVTIGDLEAAMWLDANVIEPLDAKPSMVGKMWKRPDKNAKPLSQWGQNADDEGGTSGGPNGYGAG